MYNTALLYLGCESDAMDAVDEAVYKAYFKVSLENDIHNIYNISDIENYIDENMLKLDINFDFIKIEDKEYYNSKGIYNVMNGKFESSTSFNFPIIIDMTKNIVDNEIIYFSKTVEIDNQKLTFANVYLNPAYISVDVYESESNTKQLDTLNFYIKNSDGKEFITRPNEVYLSQYNGREKKQTYYFETPYFDKNEQLDIYISKATFLSKDNHRSCIDIENTQNSNIAEGTELIAVEKNNDKIKLFLKFKSQSLHLNKCFDENNNEYNVKTISSDGNNLTISTYELEINNFIGDKIYFDLYYDTLIEFNEPLQINIR